MKTPLDPQEFVRRWSEAAAMDARREKRQLLILAFTLGFAAVFAVATVALILYGGV